MQYPENQITNGNPQVPQMNNYDCSSKTPEPSQNYNSEQIYVKPQSYEYQYPDQNNNYMMAQQTQNNNCIMQPQSPNDYYIMFQQELNNQNLFDSYLQLNDYIKDNKLTIPLYTTVRNLIFFIIIFILSILSFIAFPPHSNIPYSIIIVLINLLILFVEKNKVEIIKDEASNKILITIKNFLFLKIKKFEFDIDSVYFKVRTFGKHNILLILNNFKNGNEINLNSGIIINIPLKYLHYIKNINVNKFGGLNQLNIILNEFIDISNNMQNPLYFDINIYLNRPQNIVFQSNYNKYIKINDIYYSYYSSEPIPKSYKWCLFKVFLAIVYINVFILSMTVVKEDSREEDDFPYTIIMLGLLLAWLYCMIFSICSCVKNIKKNNFLRLDIIYSNDYDKIFIGKVMDETSYSSTNLFNLNDIDKFVLQKYKAKERGFHLLAFYKGNTIPNAEICYIEDAQLELEGLVHILNERLNNNDIIPQQPYINSTASIQNVH